MPGLCRTVQEKEHSNTQSMNVHFMRTYRGEIEGALQDGGGWLGPKHVVGDAAWVLRDPLHGQRQTDQSTDRRTEQSGRKQHRDSRQTDLYPKRS